MITRLISSLSRSRSLLAVASFCAGLLFATSSHAALESRLGGLVYTTQTSVSPGQQTPTSMG